MDGVPMRFNTFYRWLAYQLPEGLVYWTVLRAGIEHIADDEEVPAVPYVDVLKRSYP